MNIYTVLGKNNKKKLQILTGVLGVIIILSMVLAYFSILL